MFLKYLKMKIVYTKPLFIFTWKSTLNVDFRDPKIIFITLMRINCEKNYYMLSWQKDFVYF